MHANAKALSIRPKANLTKEKEAIHRKNIVFL